MYQHVGGYENTDDSMSILHPALAIIGCELCILAL